MSFKNTHLPVATMLQSKGNLLDISTPVVMGIINVTQDSFYSESRKNDEEAILTQAEKMIAEGAAILDIGGASTRPGALPITEAEEINNTTKAIQAVHHHFPKQWISIDTYRTKVAAKAIAAGAHIINDISGGKIESDMLTLAGEMAVPFIAMHSRGDAYHLHQQQQYDNVTLAVIDELSQICQKAEKAGIKDLILDPGFGFSKSIDENYELLNHLSELRILKKPILAGLSRKSMIYKTLQNTSQEALNGTTALNMVALHQGASILRVHDVQAAVECIKLWNKIQAIK